MANIAVPRPMFSADTQYHSVPSLNSDSNEKTSENESLQPKAELGNHSAKPIKRSWLRTILIQVFALAWLVPIMFLVIVNLKGFKIGASAWCPRGQCLVQAYNVSTAVPEQRIHRFDKDNHNLLGALQLVAKALEIWFELIAAALVYLVTMRLARRNEGLPIGYLTRPTEFAEIPGLFDSLLWTSAGRSDNAPRAPRWRIWIFVLMTVALCLLCNLMGPATAVLVLPGLQWIESAKVGNQTFSELNSANPPTTDWFAYSDTYNCLETDYETHKYSCTAYDWAIKLDSWMTAYVAAASEGTYGTVTQQDYSVFEVNVTSPNADGNYTDPYYWVPSRQLVNSFSWDMYYISYIGEGSNKSELRMTEDDFQSFSLYNRSLQLQLQRNGPILGTYPNTWSYQDPYSYSWRTVIDSDRALECFSWYNYGYKADNNYTKCIQDGPGWGSNTKYANFSIAGSYNADTNTVEQPIFVDVFSSDRAAFLPNGVLPDGISELCIANGTKPEDVDCDWDAFFTPPALVANASTYVNTIRMTMSNDDNTAMFVVDYVAYAGFTTYTLDPSPLSNPLYLVQTQSLPHTSHAIAVDPTWTLATWSADSGGSIPSDRSTTTMVNLVMQAILNNTLSNSTDALASSFNAISNVPIMQTLSVIDYSLTNVTTTSVSGAKGKHEADDDHPLMYRNAMVYIWAYSMGSRTAYVGVMVACLGVAVVLTQFILGIVDRRRYRSPTQLLVAALEHVPQGEFNGLEHAKKEISRVHFNIKEVEHTAGNFSFHLRDGRDSERPID